MPGWSAGRSPRAPQSTLSTSLPGHERHDDQVGQPQQQQHQRQAQPGTRRAAAALAAAAAARPAARAPAGSAASRGARWWRPGGGRGSPGSRRGVAGWRAGAGRGGWPAGPRASALTAVEPVVVGSLLGTAVPGTIGHAQDATVSGLSRPRDSWHRTGGTPPLPGLLAHLPAEADVDALHAIHSDPDLWRHFPVGRHTSRAESEGMVTEAEGQFERNGLGYWSVREVPGGPVHRPRGLHDPDLHGVVEPRLPVRHSGARPRICHRDGAAGDRGGPRRRAGPARARLPASSTTPPRGVPPNDSGMQLGLAGTGTGPTPTTTRSGWSTSTASRRDELVAAIEDHALGVTDRSARRWGPPARRARM